MSPGRHVDPLHRQSGVFVDDSGRRRRALRGLLALVILTGLGAVGLVVVSLLAGVPLAGLDHPVRLPSGEPARAGGPLESIATATAIARSGPPSEAHVAGGQKSSSPGQSGESRAAAVPKLGKPSTPVTVQATTGTTQHPPASNAPSAPSPTTSRTPSAPVSATHTRRPATPPGQTRAHPIPKRRRPHPRRGAKAPPSVFAS